MCKKSSYNFSFPVGGKMVEWLLYNKMFSFFFLVNDQISPKKFGFRSDYSCTNQLLSTAHDFFFALPGDHNVRGVFLGIS